MKYYLMFIGLLLNLQIASADLGSAIKATTKDYLTTRFLNATFMIVQDNNILDIGAKGIFNLEGRQLKANEVMPIASGTKPITAAAILRLQDQNLLNVRDVISKYLDKESDIWEGNMPKWADHVSIHHLLTHTSGLSDYYSNITIDPEVKTINDINKSIINFVKSRPLEFKLGSQYQYSNTNYIILGMIIEKISNKTIAQFFHDEFFKPLGMKSTYLPTLEKSLEIQKTSPEESLYPVRYDAIPISNKPNKPKIEQSRFQSLFVPYSDGGVFSNTRDMVNWYKALHKGKILSDKSYNLMTKKHFTVPDVLGKKTYIGYGVFISNLPGVGSIIHHSGSKGSISESGYIPEKNIYFAILGNVSMKIPEEAKDKIDLNKTENKLDIIYFKEAILKTIEQNK